MRPLQCSQIHRTCNAPLLIHLNGIKYHPGHDLHGEHPILALGTYLLLESSPANLSLAILISQRLFGQVDTQLSCLSVLFERIPLLQFRSLRVLFLLNHFPQLSCLLLEPQDLALVICFRRFLATWNLLWQIGEVITEAHGAGVRCCG